ncbi:fibronectin type III domain-containing protein [Microbacterium sp.]|uniref:fibronectin type III domain-containing protein n=1 Tax=Microbacterium sp. TaxID=51671 RepID=UPI003A846EF4
MLAVSTAPSAATAATSRPGQVGLVNFVGSSLSGGKATLRLDWASVSGASSYKVFVSRTYDGVAAATRPVAQPTGSGATIRGLTPGVDYFVQVSAVNSAGTGFRSQRVGHGTIKAEASSSSLRTHSFRLMTWNVCSVQCSSMSSRTRVINERIGDLKPGFVVAQEASSYSTAPSGYRFAVNGQNDILYRTSEFSPITNDGKIVRGETEFASKYASNGKGAAWAAFQDRATGRGLVVVTVHLRVGDTSSTIAQREYEASRLSAYVDGVVRNLSSTLSSRWASAPVVIAGDFNTHKSRAGDDSQEILERAGWFDAYDQSRALNCQHCNSANPTMQAAPVIGVKWGDHVDKVLVRPSHAIVEGWANAGERSGYNFVTPLGSDHHPVLVRVMLG